MQTLCRSRHARQTGRCLAGSDQGGICCGVVLLLCLFGTHSEAAPPLQAFDAGGKELDVADFDLAALLNPEVTAASRYVQQVQDIAAPVIVITREQIAIRGYRDIKDVFRDLPGFDISSNVQGEVRTLVHLRGILGNQKLLILQDGQRLNAATGERFLYGNNVPIHHAERIEVIYGPASAVYGPDAYAGVVNIVTLQGADIQGVQLSGSGGRLSTAGDSWVTDDHLMVGSRFGDEGDALLSLRFYHSPNGADISSDYQELRAIDYYDAFPIGLEHQEPVKAYDAYAKLRYGNLNLMLRYSDATETNAPSTIPDNYVYTAQNVWRQRLGHVALSHELRAGEFALTTVAMYQLYQVDPQTNFTTVRTYNDSPDVAWNGEPIKIPTSVRPAFKFAQSDSARVESHLTWNVMPELILAVGMLGERSLSFPITKHLRDGPFNSDSLSVDMSEFADPSTGLVLDTTHDRAWGTRPATNVGAFAQGDWQPMTPLRLSAGARYDHSTRYGSTFNPRLGAVFRQDDTWGLRAMVGSAYIQPSNHDIWENWATPFAMHIPNPALRPERIVTADMGGDYRISEHANVTADLFYNHMSAIIRPVRSSSLSSSMVYNPYRHPEVADMLVETNANSGRQHTYGGELKFDYVMPAWHAFLSYAFVDGQDQQPHLATRDQRSFTISKISHHKVLAGVDGTLWERITMAPRLRWLSPVTMSSENSLLALRRERAVLQGDDPNDVSTTFGKSTGAWLLDATVTGQLVPGVLVYVSLFNILNQKTYGAAPFGESVWVLPRAPQLRFHFLVGITYQLSS